MDNRSTYVRRDYDPLISTTAAHLERRQNKRLYHYWNQLRAKRPFPSEEELDSQEIESLWGQCFLIQARDLKQVRYYNYSYLGPVIIHTYQSGQITHPVPRIVAPNAEHLAEEYEKILDSRLPIWHHGETEMGSKLFLFEQCMLPLGSADGHVHSVLGRLGFRFLD